MTTATTSITPERFSQGLTITEYMNGMQENREKLEANYSNAMLTRAEIERIQQSNIPVNVLVIAEDWCGDVLRYLPMLARMAEVAFRHAGSTDPIYASKFATARFYYQR